MSIIRLNLVRHKVVFLTRLEFFDTCDFVLTPSETLGLILLIAKVSCSHPGIPGGTYYLLG